MKMKAARSLKVMITCYVYLPWKIQQTWWMVILTCKLRFQKAQKHETFNNI